MRECYTRDWATRLYADKAKPCREAAATAKVTRSTLPALCGYACEGLPSFTVCWDKESGKAWKQARMRYGAESFTIEERLAAQAARLAEIDAERVRALDPMAPAVGCGLAFEARNPDTGKGQTVTLETSKYQREVWRDNAKFRRNHDKAYQSSLSEQDKEAQAALAKEARKVAKEAKEAQAAAAAAFKAARPLDINKLVSERASMVKPNDGRVIRRKLPTRPHLAPHGLAPWGAFCVLGGAAYQASAPQRQRQPSFSGGGAAGRSWPRSKRPPPPRGSKRPPRGSIGRDPPGVFR